MGTLDSSARTVEPVPLSAFVPPELKQALRESAQRNSRSMSGELRLALLAYLVGPADSGEVVSA
jgi:hypothetical protein